MADLIEIHPGVMRQLDHHQAVYTGTAEALIATRVDPGTRWITKAACSALFKKIWHLNEVRISVSRSSILPRNKVSNLMQGCRLNHWRFSLKSPPKVSRKKYHCNSLACYINQVEGIAAPQEIHTRTIRKASQGGDQLELKFHVNPSIFIYRKIIVDRYLHAKTYYTQGQLISKNAPKYEAYWHSELNCAKGNNPLISKQTLRRVHMIREEQGK